MEILFVRFLCAVFSLNKLFLWQFCEIVSGKIGHVGEIDLFCLDFGNTFVLKNVFYINTLRASRMNCIWMDLWTVEQRNDLAVLDILEISRDIFELMIYRKTT